MKLVTKTHRVLAVLMGVVVLVALVVQILRDGRQMEMKELRNYQSTTK